MSTVPEVLSTRRKWKLRQTSASDETPVFGVNSSHIAIVVVLCLLLGLSLLWHEGVDAVDSGILLPALLPLIATGAAYISRPLVAGAFLATTSGVVAFSISEPGAATFLLISLGVGAFIHRLHVQARTVKKYHDQSVSVHAQLNLVRSFLHSFEDNGKDWFWQTDEIGRLNYMSPVLGSLTGYNSDSEITLIDLLRNRFNKTVEQRSALRVIDFNMAACLPFNEVAFSITVDSTERWLSLNGKPAFSDHGKFIGYTGLASDLTEVRHSEAQVRQSARFDALTRLANRTYFRDTLEDVLNRSAAGGLPCALLFIDLDRFKIVNDTLGHSVGDALLQMVAERLEYLVKRKGRVGRFGGDEFVALIVDARDKKAVAALATRIIRELSAPYTISETQIVIGASIGVAFGTTHGENGDQLIQNADLALYAAKQSGRGMHCFFDGNMRTQAETRQALETELRQALVKNQLHLLYQPIFDTITEKLTGFEALLRWDHPTRGTISPEIFIPIAEEANLIGRIGEWAIRTACMQASKWPKQVRIAVNMSPNQFLDVNLSTMILNALASSQLSPSRLELEITESVFLNADTTTHATLDQLKNLGIHLALDDFGTGYSSLGYLRRASFSKIKIDKSFVRGITNPNSENVAIVRAVVALAVSLGMVTTAEGAETPEEVQALRALGCSQIQGFYYSRPLDSERAAALAACSETGKLKTALEPRKARIQLLRAAYIKAGKAKYSILVRNLSEDGLMAQVDADLTVGTRVTIQLTGFAEIRGVIKWTQPTRIGVLFERPVNLDNLTRLTSTRLRRTDIKSLPAHSGPQRTAH